MVCFSEIKAIALLRCPETGVNTTENIGEGQDYARGAASPYAMPLSELEESVSSGRCSPQTHDMERGQCPCENEEKLFLSRVLQSLVQLPLGRGSNHHNRSQWHQTLSLPIVAFNLAGETRSTLQ